VNADVKMMERVIQNLVENAVKNTPEGGSIVIELQRRDNELNVVFQNTGKPLPQELVHWINSQTENNTHTRPPGNTGLGLAIVKRVLELHHLGLTVQTQTGPGNHFSFSMPLYNS
jgi:signal transduction histidine kinase